MTEPMAARRSTNVLASDVRSEQAMAMALPELDNVILRPHAAFYSTGSVAALQRLAADEVRRALTGQ